MLILTVLVLVVAESVFAEYADVVLNKRSEQEGVRLYVGENFFGQDLIDLFHREVALQAPRLPRQHKIDLISHVATQVQ